MTTKTTAKVNMKMRRTEESEGKPTDNRIVKSTTPATIRSKRSIQGPEHDSGDPTQRDVEERTQTHTKTLRLHLEQLQTRTRKGEKLGVRPSFLPPQPRLKTQTQKTHSPFPKSAILTVILSIPSSSALPNAPLSTLIALLTPSPRSAPGCGAGCGTGIALLPPAPTPLPLAPALLALGLVDEPPALGDVVGDVGKRGGPPRPTKLPLVSNVTLFTSAARSADTLRLIVDNPAFSCTDDDLEDEGSVLSEGGLSYGSEVSAFCHCRESESESGVKG